MIIEAQARIAGQIAAADAICEFADRITARDAARLMGRIDRVHATRRARSAKVAG